MDSAEIRSRFLRYFADREHQVVPVGVAAAGRPDAALRQCGHGPVQALLPGRGAASVPPGHQRPEGRAHPRHRGGRQDRPACLVLPDGGQLLVRRLLQGGGDPPRLGAAHQAGRRRRLRLPRGEALGDGLPGRRRGARHLAPHRRPAPGPHPAAQCQGQLLVHGRPGPGRTLLGDLLRPRARATDARAARRPTRTATSRSGTSSSCRTSCPPSGPRWTSTSGSPCPPRTSTPAWASSGWRRSSRASTTSTRSTPRAASSTARAS